MKTVYQLFDLSGKSGIITGASQGLGFGIAECFARAGMNLVLVNRNASDGEAAQKKLAQYGGKVIAIPTDVSHRSSVEEMTKKAVSELGKIDVLVNNAAIINRGALMDLSEQDWDETLDINLKGYFLCGQAVARHMVENGGGKIINFASIRSGLVADERGSYCTSKGGVVQLTKSMAFEWAKYNIRVNGIAPGYFGTRMVTDYFAKMPEMEKNVVNGTPLGRIGIPTDLYGIAIFFASSASDYLTGQIIYVDGGWSIWKF